MKLSQIVNNALENIMDRNYNVDTAKELDKFHTIINNPQKYSKFYYKHSLNTEPRKMNYRYNLYWKFKIGNN